MKISKGDYLDILPEWQDPGDDMFEHVALEDEAGGRVRMATLGTGLAITPTSTVETRMVKRRENRRSV